MNIHELNTKAITNPAYVALDDGSDTYKLDLNAKLSTMQNSISGAESNIATAQGDITLLQTNMSQAQGAISSAQGEITDLQSDLNALSTQTAASIGNLQTEIDSAEDDITDLKNETSKIGILDYTDTEGFINAYGSYVSATADVEKYTNRFAVAKGDLITFDISFSASKTIWVAYTKYNLTGGFVERVVLNLAAGTSYHGEVTIGDNVGAVEFMYKTYGTSEPTICRYRSINPTLNEASESYNAITKAELVKPISDFVCELGGIYSGSNTDSTSRCRTADFIRVKAGDSFRTTDPSVYYVPMLYNSDGTWISGAQDWITSETVITNTNAVYARLTMRKKDNTTITSAEMAELAAGVELVRSDIWETIDESFPESAIYSGVAQKVGNSYTCELGLVYGGEPYDSTSRCRTGFIEAFNCKVMPQGSNYFTVSLFDNDKKFIRETGWLNIDYIANDANMRYIRLTMRKKDSATIESSEVQSIASTFDIIRQLDGDCFVKSYELPAYFESEAQDCLTKLNAYCTEKALAFGIVTDTHVYLHPNSQKWWHDTVANMARVNELYPLDSVIHLGDIINGSLPLSSSVSLIEEVRDDINTVLNPTFMLVGNHDPNMFYNDGSDPIEEGLMYALIERYNEIHTSARPSGKPYWYKDYEPLGIRVIYLSAHMGDGYDKSEQSWGYPQAEITWFTNEALNTDKQVLILSHMPFTPGYVSGISTVPLNGDTMKAAANAFINNGGTVIGLINGHTHFDYVHDNGTFKEISLGAECNTENTATKTGTNIYSYAPSTAVQYGRTFGTVTQDLWTILVVRPTSQTCKLIRFGAGNDVEWSY